MSVWGGWAERTYERSSDGSPQWFWLRLFGIPRTRSNCVRFLKGVSLFGMGLTTVMLVVILVWANDARSNNKMKLTKPAKARMSRSSQLTVVFARQ